MANIAVRLSKYLVDVRKGRATDSEDEIQLMKDLVTQHSTFSEPQLNQACYGGDKTKAEQLNGYSDQVGEHVVSSHHCYPLMNLIQPIFCITIRSSLQPFLRATLSEAPRY